VSDFDGSICHLGFFAQSQGHFFRVSSVPVSVEI